MIVQGSPGFSADPATASAQIVNPGRRRHSTMQQLSWQKHPLSLRPSTRTGRPIPTASLTNCSDPFVYSPYQLAPFQAVNPSAASFNLTGSKTAMFATVYISGNGLIATILPRPPWMHAERHSNAR